jgi:hypothetical protein
MKETLNMALLTWTWIGPASLKLPASLSALDWKLNDVNKP